jgi:hypothetical protein
MILQLTGCICRKAEIFWAATSAYSLLDYMEAMGIVVDMVN